MPLTKHRTLSGSCLVSAWLNSGEQLSADTKQDGDGQLTQSEESARNLTEEVNFCMEFELTGIVLLAAIATSLLSITHHPLYFSLLDSSIQVKATVRQQGFADYKGEAISTIAFYLTAKNINRKAFIQFFVEFVTRSFAEEGDLTEASVTAAAKLLPQVCLRARQARDVVTKQRFCYSFRGERFCFLEGSLMRLIRYDDAELV